MRRIAAIPILVAVGCLLPVSVWWFVELPGLLKHYSAATGNLSASALEAVLLLQLLSICLYVPYWAMPPDKSTPNHRPTLDNGLLIASLVAPAWPFLAILSLASHVRLSGLIVAEAAVFLLGFLIVRVAQHIGKLPLPAEVIRLLQLSLGIGVAATIWTLRIDLLQWLR